MTTQVSTLRKKPTRRGGKRARHRPCHIAAAAQELASGCGSIETPSFGDPGSGEEAEGEADSEAKVSIANGVLSRSNKEVPSSSRPARPRSFYPLAARLRVASAGLRPRGQVSTEASAPATSSNHRANVPEAKTSSRTCHKQVMHEEQPEETIHEEEDLRAPTEEVEPEPASAADSDERVEGSAQRSLSPPTPSLNPSEPADTRLLGEQSVLHNMRKTELAFVTAKSPALTASKDGISSKGIKEGEAVVGQRVLIKGLLQSPQYNSLWGKVEAYDAELRRYLVHLFPANGTPILAKLRRENLHIPPALVLEFADSDRQNQALYPQSAVTSKLNHGSAETYSRWRPTMRLWQIATDLQEDAPPR